MLGVSAAGRMKILVVVAHKASSRGETLTKRYLKQIRAAFAACTHFQERLDIMVRNHSQLAEFVPPPAGETDVPDIVQVRDRLASLDGLDEPLARVLPHEARGEARGAAAAVPVVDAVKRE